LRFSFHGISPATFLPLPRPTIQTLRVGEDQKQELLSTLNSFALILSLSFFSNPNTKNHRFTLFVATNVRVLPLYRDPAAPRVFYDSAAKIGIDQPSLHFLNTPAKRLNRKIGFTEPSIEVTRHEHSLHCCQYIT